MRIYLVIPCGIVQVIHTAIHHLCFIFQLAHIYNGDRERVRRGVQRSLNALGLDYVDLFLIHAPYTFKVLHQISAQAQEIV